jgi:hypothetical protein
MKCSSSNSVHRHYSLVRLFVSSLVTVAAASVFAMDNTNDRRLPQKTRWIRTEDDSLSTLFSKNTNDWISFHRTVEFLPATHTDDLDVVSKAYQRAWDTHERRRRQLDEAINGEDDASETTKQTNMDGAMYRISPFADGAYEYDSYQQAWRLLGFMIDCDDQYLMSSSNNDDDGNNNRKGSGSGDGGTGEGCHRYVIWAAVCVCVCWLEELERNAKEASSHTPFIPFCMPI